LIIRRTCRRAAFAKKGGRKCYLAGNPEVTDAFVTVIDVYTAGDPVQDGVLWTNLTRAEIAAGLAAEGFEVSVTVVDRLLDEFELGQRKPQKTKTMRHDPDRDRQFRNIAALKQEYFAAGLPVLSMDVKKREMLGDYVRPGRLLSTAPLPGWDHDFATHSRGVVIPHGLYDLGLNEGYLHLGDSHETSEFAADALLDWWRSYGRRRYPQAAELLLLCDNGGSNGSNRLIFKEQLQRVADRTDLSIRVAHYPPGCSKYNPIEHRLFPHVTRKLQGLFLKSIDLFRDLARQATTAGGLRVFARQLRGLYEKGKHAAVESVDQLHILFAPLLPRWNYFVLPEPLWDVI
jgi:hypothetical protein